VWLFPAILAAMLFARLSFAGLVYARPELALANDSDRYVPIANAILSGEAYAWNTERPGELLNTAGYPLFLAGVFLLRGSQPGDVALAQLAITALVVLIIYIGLSRWIGRIPAFVSAMLLGMDPLTILWSMTILTESLFAVMLGLGAALLAWWAHSGRRLTLILSGIFCGLACLVKPFALLIVLVWAAALLWFPQDGRAGLLPMPSARARRALLFLVPVFLLIVPWFARNALLWDCATLSSVDRVTMRDYMATKVLAEADGVDLGTAQSQLQAADPGVCPRETTRYLQIIASHPAVYAKLHAAGTIPVLIGTNFDRWLQYYGVDYTLPDLWRPFMDGGWEGLVAVVKEQMRVFPQGMYLMGSLTAYQLLVYVLALGGVVAVPRIQSAAARWSIVVMLAGVLVLILAPGQGGHERFRVPAQPLLAILAAYGIAARRPGWSRHLSTEPQDGSTGSPRSRGTA
jgi:4-amino-4-deoxy-L-arabinose transferase-like glycosyltransferase